jgi:hypothetical protein
MALAGPADAAKSMDTSPRLPELPVRQVPAEERVSGFVGLVLLPDPATILEASALAAALLPPDAPQRLGPGLLPHVTLTQCAVRDAPRARVRALAARLDERLAGQALPLGRVAPFPGGFLFWCVDAGSPARQLIQAAHEEALALADGALDPAANAAVVDGTARATGGDAQLVANARRHGYAFVRDRYLPHITLGFDPRSAVLERRDHLMTVERVLLVRLGRLGSVEAVLAL